MQNALDLSISKSEKRNGWKFNCEKSISDNQVAIVGKRWKLSQPPASSTSLNVMAIPTPPPPPAIPVSIAADESIAYIDDDLGGHIPSVTEV